MESERIKKDMEKESPINPYAHKLMCNRVTPLGNLNPNLCTCRTHDPDCIHTADYPSWLEGSIVDTLCDCGLTWHHRDCAALGNEDNTGTYAHYECTCGFSQPSSVTYAGSGEATTSTIPYDPDEENMSWTSRSKSAPWAHDIKSDGVVYNGYTGEVTPLKAPPSHFSYCPAYKETWGKCTCDETGHEADCTYLIDPFATCDCRYTYGEELTDKDVDVIIEKQAAAEWLSAVQTPPYEAQSEWQGTVYATDEDQVIKLELTNPTPIDYNAAISLLVAHRDKEAT